MTVFQIENNAEKTALVVALQAVAAAEEGVGVEEEGGIIVTGEVRRETVMIVDGRIKDSAEWEQAIPVIVIQEMLHVILGLNRTEREGVEYPEAVGVEAVGVEPVGIL